MGRIVAALVIAFSVTAIGQTSQTWISISADGQERGAFAPRPAPYTNGGPSVSVALWEQQGVRGPDGLIITAFEFIGWREGDSTRVQVFALVPRKDAPNVYRPALEGDLLERRDFATYAVGPGQKVEIAEMKPLGAPAMTLISELR
jgi:hypothetical protein